MAPLRGKIGRLHLGMNEGVQYVIHLFSAKSALKEGGQE